MVGCCGNWVDPGVFIKIINQRGGLRGWAALAAGLAVLATIAVLAIGLVIFVLPIVLLAPIVFWLLPKPKPKRAPASVPASNKQSSGAQIIDGSFTVTGEKYPPRY